MVEDHGKADGLFANPSTTAFFADAGDSAPNAFVLSNHKLFADASTSYSGISLPSSESAIYAKVAAGGSTNTSGIHSRHGNQANVCYADGHVQAVKDTSIPTFSLSSSKFWCPAYTGNND